MIVRQCVTADDLKLHTEGLSSRRVSLQRFQPLFLLPLVEAVEIARFRFVQTYYKSLITLQCNQLADVSIGRPRAFAALLRQLHFLCIPRRFISETQRGTCGPGLHNPSRPHFPRVPSLSRSSRFAFAFLPRYKTHQLLEKLRAGSS